MGCSNIYLVDVVEVSMMEAISFLVDGFSVSSSIIIV